MRVRARYGLWGPEWGHRSKTTPLSTNRTRGKKPSAPSHRRPRLILPGTIAIVHIATTIEEGKKACFGTIACISPSNERVLYWNLTQIRLCRYTQFVLSDQLLGAVTRDLGITQGGHAVEWPSYATPEAYWEFWGI